MRTRSTYKITDICTIFDPNDHLQKVWGRKYYKGELTKYDAKNKYYTVRYTDGNIGEKAQQEITGYKKKKNKRTPTNDILRTSWRNKMTNISSSYQPRLA